MKKQQKIKATVQDHTGTVVDTFEHTATFKNYVGKNYAFQMFRRTAQAAALLWVNRTGKPVTFEIEWIGEPIAKPKASTWHSIA